MANVHNYYPQIYRYTLYLYLHIICENNKINGNTLLLLILSFMVSFFLSLKGNIDGFNLLKNI